MDCCICSPTAAVYRPPRNTICQSCYEGARCMGVFLSNLEGGGDDELPNPKHSNGSHSNSIKGLSSVFKWMEEMKGLEKNLKEKMGFLEEMKVTFNEGILTDIFIKPGCGPQIPAHRAILATKSEIFRTMLGSDECKAPPEDTISLPELSHEDLQCLLEFLYSGSLPEERAEKHAHALLLAADKYDIPFLKKFCVQRILGSLGPSNALEVLEVSEVCSNGTLKESAMDSIVRHMDEIVFSSRFDRFALRNANLCVEITRMLVRGLKDKKDVGIV